MEKVTLLKMRLGAQPERGYNKYRTRPASEVVRI